MENNQHVQPGQIRYIQFEQDVALQGGLRPALIVQNMPGCIHSPRIWAIPLTTKINKARHLPMHVSVPKTAQNGLRNDSVALVEQARFVERSAIKELVGFMEQNVMWECGNAVIKNWDIFSPNISTAARFRVA